MPRNNSESVWHKLMALLLKPFIHASKAQKTKKMPTQSKARKFVGHKNQYVNGQKFATFVCMCISPFICECVCVSVYM